MFPVTSEQGYEHGIIKILKLMVFLKRFATS